MKQAILDTDSVSYFFRGTSQVVENDVLIAGIALEQDMVLITNNTSHFDRIEGLDFDNWIF